MSVLEQAPPVQQSRVLRNLAVLYLGQLLTGLMSLAPIVFVPQYLDAVGVGKLNISYSLTEIFEALILMGTAIYVVREIARDRSRVSELIFNGLILRAGLALLLFPVMVAVLYLLNYPPETRLIVFIMYGMITVSMFSQLFASALQALEYMAWRSAAIIAGEVVAVFIGWFVLYQGGGVIGYVLVLALAMVVELIVNASYFVMVARIRPIIRLQTMVQMLRGGIPFFLWAFLQTIYYRSSSLMLSKLGGEEAVGWFGVANQLVIPLYTIPSVIITVLLPQFSQLSAGEPATLRRAVSRAVSYMTIITMPLALGLSATAGRVIELFNYPATFQHSVPVLRILALTLPGTSLVMVIATAIAAMNKERGWARISAFSLVASIALNIGLIPLSRSLFNNPAVGGALSTLLVEILILTMAVVVLGPGMLERQTLVTFGKTMFAAGVMVAGVLVAQPLPLPLVIVLGGIVYMSIALLIHLFPPEDVQNARNFVSRKWQVAAAAFMTRFGRGR